jgi:hypothetical protein
LDPHCTGGECDQDVETRLPAESMAQASSGWKMSP